MTVTTTPVAAPTPNGINSGESYEMTKYVTRTLVNPYGSASASAAATNTDVVFPVQRAANSGLHGTHLAAAVGLPVVSVFALCLLGLFLIKRRRQKKRDKETTQAEMAGVTGHSQQTPLVKPSVGQPKDGSSHQSAPGLPPMDLEQPAPVAFPTEQSRTDPGGQPFSYAGYFSGIDTSGAESQHIPANGLSYRAMSPDPPPPYAPRSESAISRSNSACLAHPQPINAAYRLSRGDMASQRRSEIRSPFADPEEDDAESQAPSVDVDGSEVIRRRGTDDVSVVSSVSDRGEETLTHQMV
ncbi:hypothetical protein FGG08_002438 [Glutinoglossum americanum]|uniref:Uncharacterized protein n=1 Tax=Glutinoglossum americanum TaxID=1670608 RepID=A0A9P8L5M1_9PEZI|nr:hypothetical protein FGG08_002438 [Glutinoglossum americanum]